MASAPSSARLGAMTAAAHLFVRDLMSAPAVTAPPDATLAEVARRMLDEHVGSVVIVDPRDPDVPAGIVTETDFSVAADPVPFTFFKWPSAFGEYVWSEESMEAVYDAAREQRAAAVMSSPVTTVDAGTELWEGVRTMVASDVKRVPVLEDGRLVGVLARHDLLKFLARDGAG